MVRTLVFVVFFVTVVHLPAVILIGLWFLLQVFQGITSVGMDAGTAFWAHVGGLIVGALLTLLFRGRNYQAASPTVIRGY
jgi:membrane associated rhomboid family serine protease